MSRSGPQQDSKMRGALAVRNRGTLFAEIVHSYSGMGQKLRVQLFFYSVLILFVITVRKISHFPVLSAASSEFKFVYILMVVYQCQAQSTAISLTHQITVLSTPVLRVTKALAVNAAQGLLVSLNTNNKFLDTVKHLIFACI